MKVKVYPRAGRRISCYLLPIFIFILNCAPPAHWKPSPYLIAHFPGSSLKGRSQVRVKLYEGKPIPVSSSAIFKFKSEAGSKFHKAGSAGVPSGDGIYIAKNDILKFKNKNYHGKIQVKKTPGGVVYINLVSMPMYLVSVLGHEMSNSWPIEALKAQAVVSRSYAAARMIEAAQKDYDMDTTTNYQVYGGIPKQKENLEEAVRSTKGELLTHNSELAKVFFHASCGGKLEAAHEIWKENIPYLQVKKSDFCRSEQNYRWSLKVPSSKVYSAMGFDNIQKISVSSRTASGRAKELRAFSSGKEIKINPIHLRKKLGAARIKSYFFDIRKKGGHIEMAGRGYGHGVGLCQWGARSMAGKNMRYRKILKHFFPGTGLTRALKLKEQS